MCPLVSQATLMSLQDVLVMKYQNILESLKFISQGMILVQQ
jgi:hypothetical protein